MTRFNVATPLDQTPSFVLWTLVQACPLREASDFTDPEMTERLLRGARCYSDAFAEGRVINGIVLSANSAQEPVGFSVEQVFEPLGGLQHVMECCANCPANALAKMEVKSLARCVGYLVPPNNAEFHRLMDDLLGEFSNTTPRWYGLWLDRPLSASAVEWQLDMWRQYQSLPHAPAILGLADYQAALETAAEKHLSLRVQVYPHGTCTDRRWTVAAHCGRCRAPWPEVRRQQCRVCGQVGGRQHERTRRRMGTRPFRLLTEFLTADEIAKLQQLTQPQ